MGCTGSKFIVEDDIFDMSRSKLSHNLVWLQERSAEERYEILELLDKGSIGEIYVARRKQSRHHHLTTHDRRYAMKTFRIDSKVDKSRLKEFGNEVSVLQKLHHPNIIRLREVFVFEKKIYMMMDLCTGGHLNVRSFSEFETCSIVKQILRALAYMHDSIGICHRDLKMENVMIESAKGPPIVKLIDFGMSQMLSKLDPLKALIAGTVYTIAPEVLLGSQYTKKADLWSVGVIAFYLLSGDYPFLREEKDFDNEDLVERLVTGRFEFSNSKWNEVTNEAKLLVINLLRVCQNFRWSAKHSLDHCNQWKKALENISVHHDMMHWLHLKRTEQPNNEPNLHGTVRSSSFDYDSSIMNLSGGDMSVNQTSEELYSSAALDSRIAQSIRNFAEYGHLKRAALMITAFQLDMDELHHLKSVFLETDTELNGEISLNELKVILSHHGIDDPEILHLFDSMDQDGSGMCSYIEFLAATLEGQGLMVEDRLIDTFQRLDVKHKGYITKEDLKIVMGPTYPDHMLDHMMEEGEALHGKIYMDSFIKLMRPKSRYHEDGICYLRSTSNHEKPDLINHKLSLGKSIFFSGDDIKGFKDHSAAAIASIRMGILHGPLEAMSKEAVRKERHILGGHKGPPESPVSRKSEGIIASNEGAQKNKGIINNLASLRRRTK